MLQSIKDIQIFTKLIDEIPNTEENIVDINYRKQGINISPLEKGTYMHKKITQYVENKQSQKHSKYFKLQLNYIFQVKSEGENQRYQNQLDNKCLLWHDSRLTNYVGILRQGLRIAPPEAPVTSYMFGKGIYFADFFSKSAQYCIATGINPIGCLLLYQVALGMSMEKNYADYNANLMTQEYFSVKGVGKSSPEQFEQIQDGVKMARGKIEPTGISNTSLEFNEYVVYNADQIKIRYLLKIKFIFPQSIQWSYI